MKTDNFLKQYIISALWSSTDDAGAPLDDNFSADDLTRETRAAHDFWLTRNGHGAGFWDGDWKEPAASQLTEIAKSFGQFDLEVYRGRVSGNGPIKYYFDHYQGARIVRTDTAPPARTRTGYGRKLPTSYTLIDATGRRRRVYAICYSNAASLYVLVKGALYFLRDADLAEGGEHGAR